MMIVSLFTHILNMSLTGSFVILLVCLLRFLLRKSPKIISYLLWSVVLFRLLCPVSISLPVSLVPSKLSNGAFLSQWSQGYVGDIEIIHENSDQYQKALDAGREPVYDGKGFYVVTKSNELDAPQTVENTLLPILSGVWLVGMLAMLGCSLCSFWKLKKNLVGSVQETDNIYLADHIDSPFVMGLFRPKIYLPSFLSSAERGYIVLHEQHHIKRLDHLVKLLAFFALSLHWFNPLVWLSYSLLCKDMEMSCDEAVVKKMGSEIRADYCTSLLNLAAGRKFSAGLPLMFGESDAKERIKNLANWKKPTFLVLLLSVLVCIAAAGCLLPNQEDDAPDPWFFNPKNAASVAAQCKQITVRYSLPENSTDRLDEVDGEIFAKYLDSEQWDEIQESVSFQTATETLEFLIQDEYSITIYEKPTFASIVYEDDIRWYRTDKQSYQAALALLDLQKEASAESQTQLDPSWPYPPIDKTKPIVNKVALKYWDYFSMDGQFVPVLEMDGEVLSDKSIAVYSYLSAFYHTEGADHQKGLPLDRLQEESLRYFGRVPASYVNSMLAINPSNGNITPTGWDVSPRLYLLQEKEALPDGKVRAVFSVYYAYDGSSDWPINSEEYEYALLSGQLNCLPPIEPLTAEMILTEKTAEDGSFYVQYHSIHYSR